VTDYCLPTVGGIFALNLGSDVKLNGTVDVTGNAYLYKGSVMTVGGASTVMGTVYYDANSSVQTNSSVVTAPMSSADLMLRDKILQLAMAADSEAATQPLDPANPTSMSISSSHTYTADSMKEVNVISATDISLGSGQSLTFVGTATSVFILKISGSASFGDGITLNGVAPNHLLVSISNSGSTITVGGPSGVAGTFLAPDRVLKFSGQGSFKGALISGAVGNPAIGIGGNGGGVASQYEADAFCTKPAAP
jgi:hypothetical protein